MQKTKIPQPIEKKVEKKEQRWDKSQNMAEINPNKPLIIKWQRKWTKLSSYKHDNCQISFKNT